MHTKGLRRIADLLEVSPQSVDTEAAVMAIRIHADRMDKLEKVLRLSIDRMHAAVLEGANPLYFATVYKEIEELLK